VHLEFFDRRDHSSPGLAADSGCLMPDHDAYLGVLVQTQPYDRVSTDIGVSTLISISLPLIAENMDGSTTLSMIHLDARTDMLHSLLVEARRVTELSVFRLR